MKMIQRHGGHSISRRNYGIFFVCSWHFNRRSFLSDWRVNPNSSYICMSLIFGTRQDCRPPRLVHMGKFGDMHGL
jgi:hypothetical protein